MANWTGVITNGGNKLLNEWVTGTKLSFDSAAAGTGTVDDVALMAQTALTGKRQAASIVKAERVDTGIRLKIQITAPGTGYLLNQFGIWASVDGGTTTLAAIFQNKSGVEIPSEAETPDFTYTFYALFSTSNKGSWSANVDTSALVNRQTMEDAIADARKELEEESQKAIDDLRAELVSGQVTAGLDTDDGTAILTDDGEELRAERELASADTVAALEAAMDTLSENLAKAIVED
jgi:hypothetical protein